MMRKCLKPARAILAVALLMIFASPKLYAIDTNNHYFAYGVGQKTCADYIRFREKKLDTLEQNYPRYTKDELDEIASAVINTDSTHLIAASRSNLE